MSRYSQELKQSVLNRIMPPESRSVAALSRETGITKTTLYNWRNVARRAGAVMPDRGQSKAEDWEGTRIEGYSPCGRLVHRVCGFTLACVDRPACEPALQLLGMENRERAAGSDQNLMTYTSTQCQHADTDSGFFTSCPQWQEADTHYPDTH